MGKLDQRKIDLTTNSKLIRHMWTVVGICEARTALESASQTLPGIQLAMALVRKVEAEARAQLSTQALFAASKAGFDLNTVKSVVTEFDDKGKPCLAVETYDLADLAESEGA